MTGRKRGLIVGTGVLVAAAAVVVALVVLPGGAAKSGNGGVTQVTTSNGAVQLVSSVAALSDHGTSADETAVATAEQHFAIAFTDEESARAGEANVLVSPLSAAVDLAMLELGSAGSTATELAATLRSAGLTPAEQAAGWTSVVAAMTAGASTGELQMANSLWVSKHVTVERSFLDALAAAFGNGTYQVNFQSPTATDAINSWVDHETAGHITKLFSPGDLSAATELVLANALHFHSSWGTAIASALKNASLEPQPFTTGTGTSVDVPTMMASEVSLEDATTAAWTAAELPYGNGRYAALLVEPTAGTMSSFLGSLESSGLGPVVAALKPDLSDLTMPVLKLSTSGSLDSVLSAMGLAPAYRSADFSPMFGPAVELNQAIGTVHQAVTLDVDRSGTDASAATGVSVAGSAATSHHVEFDHPFLFLIRDTVTGTVLFSSVVENPASN